MQKPLLLTIITPCFNSASFLRECVSSVCAQSYPHWELIVIDDGSTDDSLGIVDEIADPRISVIRLQHGGVSRARNAGLRLRRGGFCLFLDSDDTFEPGALQKIVDFVNDFPNVEIVQFGYRINREAFSAPERICLASGDYFFRGGLPTRTVWNNAFRANLFDNIEFSPGIRIAEDTEFAIRCYLAARYIGQIPDTLYSYRISEVSAMHVPPDAEKVRDHLRVIGNLTSSLRPLDKARQEALSLAIEQLKVSFFHALFHLGNNEEVELLIEEYKALPRTGSTKTKSLRFAEFSCGMYFWFLQHVRGIKRSSRSV